MTVYIIQKNDGEVKIGFTADLRKRVSQLRTASRSDLYVLAFAEGSVSHERYLHLVYRRDRAFGDWFRGTDGLLAYAEKVAKYRTLGFGIYVEPTGKTVDFDSYLNAIGISRTAFGALIGVDGKQLPSYERGGPLSPRMGALQYVADELRVRVAWGDLLAREGA